MRRFLVLLVAVSTALVLASCLRVMVQRVMDYDEIAQAHAVWLTAAGDVPFYDFFENHPPFAWMALAPVAGGVTDGDTLVLRLRILSLLGHVAFFALLAANMRLGRRDIDPLWTCAALLTVLISEGNIGYVVEGRADVWAAAALLGAILIARLEALRPVVRYSAFGFIAAASLFWSPKLVALAALFAVLELALNRRQAVVAFLSMLAGGAVATVLALVILFTSGIQPLDAYAMTIGYHVAFGRNGGWGLGLFRAILEQWEVAVAVVGGMAVWLIAAARRMLRPSSFEIALAVFLITQLVLVRFPYKQYYAPWLFFAAAFIPFYALIASRIRLFRVIALPSALVFLCLKAALVYQLAAASNGFARTGEYWHFMKAQAGADRRIVAPIRRHPILVRNAMYAVAGTTGADVRYGAEEVLRDLAHPVFSQRFTYAHYAAELERNRPDVIVIGEGADALFPLQRRAVEAFLASHSTAYERRVLGRTDVFVRR